MILAGYVSILGYVFFLIFGLGAWLEKKFQVELSRKVIHTGLFLVWVLIDLFLRGTVHQIVIPVIFLVLNTLSYRFGLYKGVERQQNNHRGTIYFALAITVTMTIGYFWPRWYLPSGLSAFCLTFGDGAAALVGQRFPSRRLVGSKTLWGFWSCALASTLSALVFRLLYWPELGLSTVVLLGLLAAIGELVGKGLDNFSLTFLTFGVSGLAVFGQVPVLEPALWAAVLVFLVVFLTGAITFSGSLLSMVMVFCFCCFGGLRGLAFLLGTYFAIFLLSRLKRRRAKATPGMEKKEGARGFPQILINGGLGTALVTAWGITGDVRLEFLAYVAIGGCFLDSLSSDLGVLSRKPPYDPFRRQRVAPGLSGGMSLLGTGASVLAAAVLGLVLGLWFGWPWGILGGAMVLLQTLLDTLLGSLLQVKYRCPVCGKETEKRQCCGQDTRHLRGLVWLDNNGVNLVSSLLTVALAAGICGIAF